MATASKWGISNLRLESRGPRWVATYNQYKFRPTNRGVQKTAWNFFITPLNLDLNPWSCKCPVWVSIHLYLETIQGQGSRVVRASSLFIGAHGYSSDAHQLGCHASFRFGGPCAMCGAGCHDSACMHNTAISSGSICHIYPSSHPWEASSPWSTDISLWLNSITPRVRREQLISKILFLLCFCWSILSIYGVWDFRNKSQDYEHAIAASSLRMSVLRPINTESATYLNAERKG